MYYILYSVPIVNCRDRSFEFQKIDNIIANLYSYRQECVNLNVCMYQ